MPDTCAYVMGGCGRTDCDHQHTMSYCGASRARHECCIGSDRLCPIWGSKPLHGVKCPTDPLGHEFTAPKEPANEVR